MKSNSKAYTIGQNLSSSVGDYNPPTLHDSKSMTYLNSYLDEAKKFRETTFHPVTSKNTNYDFLRYTVNMQRTQKQKQQEEPASAKFGKINRKMTQEIPFSYKQGASDKSGSGFKIEAKGLFSPKKNMNPEKKGDLISGKNNLVESVRLEKRKTFQMKGINHNNSVTDRVEASKGAIYNKKQTLNNKIFTPQSYKSRDQIKQGKIVSSFSSADLLKDDHANSPTSQSISSRLLVRSDKGERQNISLKDFEKIKYLGQGKFGQVHLVCHKITNSVFALKQIKKDVIIKNKMQQQLLMEIKMQSFFNHPNILKLYGFFNDEQNIYLILEYMEQGTLYSQLKKQKTFKQFQASKKLRDILDGVSYLHGMMIAHRDIKPENIVISNDVCKICDLGWAAICEDRRKTLCGTIDYASPELLQGKDYDIAIDLWCLGVLCFELMIGKAPFYHISRKQTMKKIINADTSDINIPNNIPNETRDFIYRLLRKNPEERMSAEQALQHSLILKYRDQELEDFRSANKKRN